jgi:hypothetical protein
MLESEKSFIDCVNIRLEEVEGARYKKYTVEQPFRNPNQPSLPSVLLVNKESGYKVELPITPEDTGMLYPVAIITEVQVGVVVKKVVEIIDALEAQYEQ